MTDNVIRMTDRELFERVSFLSMLDLEGRTPEQEKELKAIVAEMERRIEEDRNGKR